jgi:hypothetical protein
MLTRRTFLQGSTLPLLAAAASHQEAAPERQPYFPSSAHQFIWRNWDLVPVSRISTALETSESIVQRIAEQLHLEREQTAPAMDRRLRFSVLRRNWMFVPREQIAILLGISEREIEQILDQDAFYQGNLGQQPKCKTIRVSSRSLRVGDIYYFRDTVSANEEPRFGFEKRFVDSLPNFTAPVDPKDNQLPSIAYPYVCPYGDPLGDPGYQRYYPIGLLQRMAASGVDAIWLGALLRDLIPDPLFQQVYPFRPERRERLRWVIDQCKRAGLKVYLYLDEPRGAHSAFFQANPGLRGAPGRPGDGLWCLCSSTRDVQRFLQEGTAQLFRSLPELAGVILITASENPTHCYSLTRAPDCRRCRKRRGADVIGEVVRCIAAGAREVDLRAHVIAWDWSWTIVENDPQEQIIRSLPEDVTLLVDFERGSKIRRQDVQSTVDEYSLSVSGPSPRASQHLKLARARGLPVMGKAQIGTTWELGTVPFLPVPDLVAEKLSAFTKNSLHGGLLSWTLGSCPSMNWELLSIVDRHPDIDSLHAVQTLAAERYGKGSAASVAQAWGVFSAAFKEYPFSNSVVYSSFVQEGAAQRLYLTPSGFTPRIMNNFDSLRWTAPFEPMQIAAAFSQIGHAWENGAAMFRTAIAEMNGPAKQVAERDLVIMEAAAIHFQSIGLLVEFYEMRDRNPRSVLARSRWRKNIAAQLALAERFLRLCRRDSRIGFEASVGYFYLPLDVREKIAACRYLLTDENDIQRLKI